MTNTSPNPFDYGVPYASLTGYAAPGSWSESIGANDSDYEFFDSLSMVKGKQNIKLGVNMIHEKFYQITDFGGLPGFNFTGKYSGSAIGDFVLGDFYSGTASVGDSHQNLRSNYWAGYIQDDYRLTPTFTLNLGLRYDHSQMPYDTQNRSRWFDPILGHPVTSLNGAVRNGIVDPDWHGAAPRVGYAYSPRFLKNTVIRSSYGIFFATDYWNELQFLVLGPAFYGSQTVQNTTPLPTLSLENQFPNSALGGTADPFSVDKRRTMGYVQEWNFDVQHNMGKDWLLDVAYVGNLGTHLATRKDLNWPTPDPTPAGLGTASLKARQPYPQYNWIMEDYTGVSDSYQGLLTKVEKRFSNGLYLLGSYTWGHVIDDGMTDECCLDPIRSQLRGNGTYDQRSHFVVSYTYELPFGRGKHFASGVGGGVDHIISGWKLNGITTFATGHYETAYLPISWENQGNFSENRADQHGSPYPANKTYTNYLNINNFTFPGCPAGVFNPTTPQNPGTNGQVNCPNPDYRIGNSARNEIRMPGLNTWDFALLKDTRLTEKYTLQLRGEFYNGWNHENFGGPNSTLIPGEFGVIGGSLIPAREVQVAMKVIF